MLLRRADRVVRTVSCGPPTAFVALFARERVRVCVCRDRGVFFVGVELWEV